MPSLFRDIFVPGTAAAGVLLVTLVLHIALDGASGWKRRIACGAHVLGVLTQGYISWAALAAIVASLPGNITGLSALRSPCLPLPGEAYLPACQCGWPLEALLLVVSLHVARLMWLFIRPRRVGQYFTKAPLAARCPPSN